MKNLKLLTLQHEVDVEADCFCLDYNGNIYFAAVNKIYSLLNNSKDLILCAELVSEVEGCYHVIGIEHLLESDKLFIASSSGEIYLYDIYSKEVTSVGTVDSQIENFAWSPDQESLVILTGANSLILMTKDFDPVTEKSLCPDEFGESKPITVGWGSKETQFHGSEGKGAARIQKIEPKPALSYDDRRARLSWRGDGEYFVTSSIDSSKDFRQLRIWSREAILQFTGEIKDGLEECVCWRPLGNLIACSQQGANKHKIIFFEKNGLQHGEFALPFKPNTHKVIDLIWNSDSSVLLVAAERIDSSASFQVMLWTCGNYHWYLKQSFSLQKTNPQASLHIKWNSFHPYELFCLNQATGNFYKAKWTLTISSSHGGNDEDEAIVISIDNDVILVTPFAKMIVPPPLCAYSYCLPSNVQNIFFSPHSTEFGCYLGNFNLAFFQKSIAEEDVKSSDDCKMKLIAAGGNGFISKIKPYSFRGIFKLIMKDAEIFDMALCHWTWTKTNKLFLVCSCKKSDKLKFVLLYCEVPDNFSVDNKEIHARFCSDLESSVIGICTNRSGNIAAVQLSCGKVLKLCIDEPFTISENNLHPWICEDNNVLILPQSCTYMSIITIKGKDYFLGLTERFHLYCNNVVIASNCTSYYIHDEFLLITTTDHVLKCILFDWDLADLKSPHLLSDVQIQRVERGAKIVIAPSNSTKVILQMPRGNLETIHPRPLVLSCVCKHLDNLQFKEAFELSKVHRIDLNILYDHNPKAFFDNVKLFVQQLNSATNLNLFLASLKNEDICKTLYPLAYKGKIHPTEVALDKSKIDEICISIREVIEASGDDRLFLTLIATYAKKTEPELEQALIRLKKIKDSKINQALVDSALNFLLYLVDVNELIDVALGTYDLEITIMVVQKSQKDPKEFLPFYNELQSLEENYRKYKIDMHLQRYKLALKHISKCEEHFDECLSLIREQRLYIDSLNLFPLSSDRYKVVWKEYGNYLMDKRYFDEAGLVFTRCEDYEKALMAYKESLNWQAMVCAAMQLSYSDDKLISLCLEAAEKLKSNQKFLDASYLLEHYVKDVEESIVTLIEGCEWNAALLLMSKCQRHDISETHLKPALVEHHLYLSSQVDQLSKNFQTHYERLKVIKSQKKRDAELPDVVRHHEEELFSETDSVTDVASSCAESKQLSGSIMTRKSSKSRRKQKLKKYRLKEGSPDEDLALIAALSEIVIKIDALKDNFLNTIKALVQFGFDKEAKLLQEDMFKLVTFVETSMPDIWRPAENTTQESEMRFGPDSTANSIAALVQADKKCPSINKTDPELAPPQWRNVELCLQMFR